MISKLITKVGRYLAVASLIFLPVLVPAGVHAANPDLEGSLCGSANDLQISASGQGNCNTVGGDAQTKAVKSISGRLKLGLSQFRELAAFAQFGSDLDEETKKQIERGQRLTELLKQPQYQPLSIWEQVASIFAVNEGHFDTVPATKVKDAQAALLSKLGKEHKKEMDALNKGDEKVEADSVLGTLLAKVAQADAKGFAA